MSDPTVSVCPQCGLAVSDASACPHDDRPLVVFVGMNGGGKSPIMSRAAVQAGLVYIPEQRGGAYLLANGQLTLNMPPELFEPLGGWVVSPVWTERSLTLHEAFDSWQWRFRDAAFARTLGRGTGAANVEAVLMIGLSCEAFAIEHPERGMHPRLQSVLGDFFLCLARSGRRIMLETHSQPIIDRLRVWVAWQPELEKLIGVWHVQDGKMTELGLGEQGDLDWPHRLEDGGIHDECRVGQCREQRRRAAASDEKIKEK